MRIVAGRYGGRRLRAPPGGRTRPTAERVREAVFSMLGSVDGARVLDLFAGSGALGIEALSRGASSVLFVERSRGAVVSLRENLTALGIGPDRARIVEADARAALRAAERRQQSFELVFLDPPYAQAEAFASGLGVALTARLAPGARVVCETDRRGPIDLGLPLSIERRYGDTLIRIFEAATERTEDH